MGLDILLCRRSAYQGCKQRACNALIRLRGCDAEACHIKEIRCIEAAVTHERKLIMHCCADGYNGGYSSNNNNNNNNSVSVPSLHLRVTTFRLLTGSVFRQGGRIEGLILLALLCLIDWPSVRLS